VDELVHYLDENHKIFNAGINAIPGVKTMELESTYLAWVDFSGTGMPLVDVIERVQKQAKIAANHGPTYGSGGENFLRFNIGTTRKNIERAVANMQAAFSDLQ
jgi:cystathionine beta-lyase